MAKTTYNLKNIPRVPGAQIAILQSKWHREITDPMVKKCLEILAETDCEAPEVHVLPGCYELPLAARHLARNKKNLDALIIFGMILKGETQHFEMLLDTCIRGFERVMMEDDMPIINEILPVEKIEHAKARTANNDSNKGIEAALATLEIIEWRRNNSF